MKKSTLLLVVLCVLTLQLTAQQKNPEKEKESARLATMPSSISLEQLIKQKSNTYVITNENVSRISGVRNVYLRQAINGIQVSGTESSIHFDKTGKLLVENNKFLSDVGKTLKNSSQGISAQQAITSVASQMGYKISNLQEIEKIGGINKAAIFNKANISSENIPTKLIYFYKEGVGTQLVWELSIAEKTSSDWWNFYVNASTGKILNKDNWTVSCNILGDHSNHLHSASSSSFIGPMVKPVKSNSTDISNLAPPISKYRVFAMPVENPNYGTRTLVTNPENLTASPFGWHDTNGVEGAEFTNTRGNNTDAYDDDNANNNPDGKYAFSPGGNLIFDFPLNLTYSNADQSENAAITNLFYWTNIIHDVSYQYGFDEVGGNFQHNNYGKGGIGNDPVNAEAQDGSGSCNANFGTPADGSRPRMQMYVCSNRDGDFDNSVILHEYAHGISNRLTGGPSQVNCLQNQEQMGEGWSDFYGLMLTMKAGDAGADSRGVGTWLIGEGPGGPGIRVRPYSTNFGINPHTYNAIKTAVAPHGVGEIWATMLWEMTWEIMATESFDPNIYNGIGGNNVALALVTEGLRLQPCSPGFVDGRDAIIAADNALYGGAHICAIWEAFARRGLGYSANQGSSGSKTDGTEAFDLPPSFSGLNVIDEVCLSDGIQTGLSGGNPVGGIYSGAGVTDNGNGLTFTFDPSVAGAGLVTITYKVNDFCTGVPTTLTDTINVTNDPPEIICMGSGLIPMSGSKSSSVGTNIPDGNPAGLTVTMNVLENVSITDLNVNVNISHTWVGDVIVKIKSPSGTTATIIDRPGRTTSGFGCSGDDIIATLDDEASSPVENQCAGSVPTINGSFTPNNPLSVFDGENTVGIWELNVSDSASGDSGKLNSWGIDYSYQIIAPILDVTLDSEGNATINASDLLFSASVECGGYSVLAGSPLNATVSFTCSDIGNNTIAVEVTNDSGAKSTCDAIVNVIGTGGGGTLSCPGNITKSSDPGLCGAVITYTVSSPAGCGGGTLTQTAGQPSGSTFPVGTTTNTYTFNDGVNPIQTCSFDVIVTDNQLPVAICKNITVQLNASGNVSITAADVNNGSSDNCGISALSISKTSFTCANVGTNNVTLTVLDVNGNSSTCVAVVTVQDTVAPTAICKNITVQLNAAGNVSITAADVDNGSSDNCGIASMSLSKSSFTCADVGTNNVTLTVLDLNGNSSTCVAVVTVQDTIAPTAVCKNITVQLNAAGNVSITAADVDNGSSDNCGIASMSLSKSSFTCSDVGTNNVTLTVLDVNGNSSTCVAIVTVEDTGVPTAVCKNIIVQLDASGNVSITASDVDNGSSDNCGIGSLSISKSNFTCVNIGANNVTLTVSDLSGNTSTCVAVVTVEDSVSPLLTCPANQTQDPGAGNMYVVPDYFGTGEATATDNCTNPVTLTTQDPAVGTELTDGVYTVTLTAADGNGNIATCAFQLTIDGTAGVGNNNDGFGSIKMFPNPAKDLVTIINPQHLSLNYLRIYDLRGRLIKNVDMRNMGLQKSIDLSEISSSVYFIMIQGKDGQITKKLIKE